jgi:hypothetical protein
MFRQFVQLNALNVGDLETKHSSELSTYLELAWRDRDTSLYPSGKVYDTHIDITYPDKHFQVPRRYQWNRRMGHNPLISNISGLPRLPVRYGNPREPAGEVPRSRRPGRGGMQQRPGKTGLGTTWLVLWFPTIHGRFGLAEIQHGSRKKGTEIPRLPTHSRLCRPPIPLESSRKPLS